MLKRARITGYKSLWDAEISFADPLTLIIGPNAAGKTNLFDALALLSRIVTLGSVSKAFAVGHRGSFLESFSFDETGLVGNMKNATREMRFEIDVELTPGIEQDVKSEIRREHPQVPRPSIDSLGLSERYMRYILVLQTRTSGKGSSIIEESLVAINSEGKQQSVLGSMRWQNGTLYESFGDKEDKAFSPTWGEIHFDGPFAATLNAVDFPAVAAFRAELARWQFYDLDPKQMKQPGTYIETPILPTDGHDLASFFDTMQARQPRQFAQMYRELSMIIPQIEAFDVATNDRAEVDLTVREHGARFSAKLLSEGTLRVLGLLAASSPMGAVSLIGLEEPENGIHPRRLALVAEHFRNLARRHGSERQFLLTTHSPLLPEYLAPEHVVVCQRRGNRTTFTPLREAGLFPLEEPDTLPENGIAPTSLSERIVRGDYGG